MMLAAFLMKSSLLLLKSKISTAKTARLLPGGFSLSKNDKK